MANLSREQEAIDLAHIRHQNNHVSFDPDCPECQRSKMRARLDEEKRWEEYKRLNGIMSNV